MHRRELNRTLKEEEKLWKQKDGTKWLDEGDKIKKKSIPRSNANGGKWHVLVEVNGVTYDNLKMIENLCGELFVEFFGDDGEVVLSGTLGDCLMS